MADLCHFNSHQIWRDYCETNAMCCRYVFTYVFLSVSAGICVKQQLWFFGPLTIQHCKYFTLNCLDNLLIPQLLKTELLALSNVKSVLKGFSFCLIKLTNCYDCRIKVVLAKTYLCFRLLHFLKMSTPIDTADIASMGYSVGNPRALGMSQLQELSFLFFSAIYGL